MPGHKVKRVQINEIPLCLFYSTEVLVSSSDSERTVLKEGIVMCNGRLAEDGHKLVQKHLTGWQATKWSKKNREITSDNKLISFLSTLPVRRLPSRKGVQRTSFLMTVLPGISASGYTQMYSERRLFANYFQFGQPTLEGAYFQYLQNNKNRSDITKSYIHHIAIQSLSLR